uniref:CAZy families GH87 protein n=1 Tax=uncultured Stigmatella sp. TaxID=290608 RepID=A0A060BTT9_9BACT|nr:CAZy families GH87 protein [uncultured Stigmatella sp.]
MVPGYWPGSGGTTGLANFQAKMQEWKTDMGADGGFLWTGDAVSAGDLPDYAAAIIDSLLMVSFYQNANYGGTVQSLAPGSYTLSQLQAAGLSNDDVSSVRVPPGLSVVIYEDNNFAGNSWTLSGDMPRFKLLSPSANDKMSSCIVTLAPRTYKVLNKTSGWP